MRHLVDRIRGTLRRYLEDDVTAPTGEASYMDAEMREHKRDWVGAIAEYRRVAAEHPLDAECLWRIAGIYDRRLDDRERHLQTLRRIAAMPEEAAPAWIVAEARERLERPDPRAKDPAADQRPAEIELEDEVPPGGYRDGIFRDVEPGEEP